VDTQVFEPTIACEQRRLFEQASSHTTILGALHAAAEGSHQHPAAGIILLDAHGHEYHLSFKALWAMAGRKATGLRVRGVKQGDRVILMLPTSEDYLVMVCAVMMLGAVPCTVAAPTSRGKSADSLIALLTITKKLESIMCVVPSAIKLVLESQSTIHQLVLLTPADLDHDGQVIHNHLPVITPTDTVHIQLTSGSTHTPKGVVLTNQQVIANIQAIAGAVDFAPHTESTLSWLPLYHDMGFIQILISLYYQSSLVLMTPTSFLRQPLSWLQNISRYAIAMSAAPTFAYRTCIQKYDPVKLEGVNLRSWRRAFVGAEPVSPAVIRDFNDRFRPYGLSPFTLYPCYGMAETVLATTLHHQTLTTQGEGFVVLDCIDEDSVIQHNHAIPATTEARSTIEVLSMGQPVAGLHVSIQDGDGRLLPERRIGEICVRGTSLTNAYFKDETATQSAFQAGWYRTGDRGYQVADQLYVLGRIKELIIVRGRNYLPYDLELLIEQYAGVRQGYAVAFGYYRDQDGTDAVVIVAETKTPREAQEQLTPSIQQDLQRSFGFRAHEILFVRHGTIPRTTSGKRQRALCREWYLKGRFHQADSIHEES